jgi:hypothetical protein
MHVAEASPLDWMLGLLIVVFGVRNLNNFTLFRIINKDWLSLQWGLAHCQGCGTIE